MKVPDRCYLRSFSATYFFFSSLSADPVFLQVSDRHSSLKNGSGLVLGVHRLTRKVLGEVGCVTVLDEAVTVVDDPKVQPRVRGLSVGQRGTTAGCWAPGSASVMVMRYRIGTKGQRDKESHRQGERLTFTLGLMILQRLHTYSPLIYGFL